MKTRELSSERLPILDGLRGLAIILVLLHHFMVLEPANHIHAGIIKTAAFGGHGVDLFFVLSGFLITRILLNAKGQKNYFKNFYMRRFLRIFPLYYLWLLVFMFLIPFLFKEMPEIAEQIQAYRQAQQKFPWYFAYGSNFLIALKGSFDRGGLDISWSLAIEEHFYLFWPLLVWFFSEKNLSRICLAVIAGSIGLRTLLWLNGAAEIQIYVWTFTRIDTIIFGALTAISLKSGPDHFWLKHLRNRSFFYMIAALLVGMLFSGNLNKSTLIMNSCGYSLIALFFTMLLIQCLESERNAFLIHPLMKTFGKFSYAMYLFHIPISGVLKAFWIRGGHGLDTLWAQGLFYVLATSLTVTAAFLSWNLLERHCLALKRLFPQ